MKHGILLASVATACIVAPAALAQSTKAHRADDIVVTATALQQRADETVTPVLTLGGDELVHRRQATLGETLAGQPGVNFDNFGGGASRPVIRGQTAPRVQVLSDASQIQDASQVSPDHAVVAEPLLMRGIEVLRGPATLLYGGGAIGGAVNVLDSRIPTALPANGVAAVAEARLGTADNEQSLVGGMTGAIGNFAVRVEGVARSSDDYRVPSRFGDRRVDGSYNDTSTWSVGGAWVGERGYIGAAYTRQASEYGLPGHSHDYEDCHPHGASLHCGGHDDHADHDDGHDHDHDHDEEGHDEVPYVRLRSERIDIRSDYEEPLPGFERVRFRAGMTTYRHEELEHDEVATTFRNKAHDVRLELTHKPLAGLRGTFGVQHARSDFSAIGTEAYLPESKTTNTGLFLFETLQFGPVRFEGAVRQEWQRIETTLNRRAEHNPFSLSGAAIWEAGNGYSVALSLARSQRAPMAQELFARGVHLATNTYELGDATLGKETAHSIDVTLRKSLGDTHFTLGAYHQDFDGYIYAETLDRFEDFRLIRYTAHDATFTGIDGEVHHQFSPTIGLAVFGDYVRAKFKDEGGNLPRIPAGRLGARGDVAVAGFAVNAEYFRVFEQSRISSYETRTPGYDMVNATVSYKLALGEQSAELYVRGTNLTNALAFNHASFIKDASPLRGRNVVFGLRTMF
ncbi:MULTISPECIES: TonB-dependent receptor domain-containing protein [Novosphingobium]|jgi:iron complex outermembrane receptor protein|uniref:TonB-dependent receptor domain-containing protein n=1 Tax=Novosphingobium TaxID=165696 RepID=UPI0022F25613|nr:MULTISPECIES: TonB-dependent receptor [Novosphingobium]GLK46447.1 outer membrane protein [Novosphingobium resinovorum]